MRLRLLVVVFTVYAVPASAEVVQSGGTGFATKAVARVVATPGETWAALIDPAGYWNPEHSWSGDGANFTLDAQAGGCFCEKIPATVGQPAGSAEHMRVIHARPGELLRMRGSLGPLQGEALTGTLTVTLKPSASGTEITWEYVVGGYARFDMTQIAPLVDQVMDDQLGRLVNRLGEQG